MTDRSNALKLLDVSRETIELLAVYEKLLRDWMSVTNLVGPSALQALWTRHFVDSLQLLRVAPGPKKWVDMGTGAGFPGLVIAIALREHAAAYVHLIEPDNRKCAFLREVARATGVRATVHRARAEDVINSLDDVDIVTSRAMAPLDRLIAISYERLRSGAVALFPKGQGYRTEMGMLDHMSDLKIDVIPSLTDGSAAVLRVSARALGPEDDA